MATLHAIYKTSGRFSGFPLCKHMCPASNTQVDRLYYQQIQEGWFTGLLSADIDILQYHPMVLISGCLVLETL